MVWYKLGQEYPRDRSSHIGGTTLNAAPAFEALDQNNSITRLKTFLGRHNLFIVFFDDRTGAGSDSILQHLKQHARELSESDFHVIAISSALPQQNRTTTFPQSFHLLTDPAPIWRIHRDWGCFDDQAERPTQAVFFIDRAGNVSTKDGIPIPIKNPGTEVDRLLKLSHAN